MINDISNQSKLLNSKMKEKPMDLGEIKISEEDKEIEKAVKIQKEIMDIFIKYNCTLREAHLISLALADSIHSYAKFGTGVIDVLDEI